LPRSLLREASERELYAHLERYGGGSRGGRVGEQVVGELTRREDSQQRAAARRGRARDARASRDSEFRAHLENEWIAAERQTRGNMLSKAGERAGVDPRSLFTGPESRARKYASRELLGYFEDHPRVSRAEFHGGGEAQRRGARSRAEGGLLGISRTAPDRPRRRGVARPAEPARGGDELRGALAKRGRADSNLRWAIKRQYRTRISDDSKGWVVVKDGKALPTVYDHPRAAQGAMAKAINAEERAAKARMPARRNFAQQRTADPYGLY
jgi:hypothetical protein